MKKLIIIAIIFLLPVVFVSAGEITMQRLVGFDNYVPMFMGSAPQPANPNTMRVDSRYMRPITTDDNYEMFAGLAGSLSSIDTYLEFILASYYSPAVVQIRPAEADAILPVNNPRQADLKLGAAVFQEIQILRFLASSADPTGTGSATATAAVGRHEGILKFITDRGNVTRADIEAFYRNGIRALISEIVTEEFNKISFVMDNPSRNISYDAVLTRNPQNGRFTLSYVRPSVPNNRNEISDSSLDTLLVQMRRDTVNFDQTCINTVRAQATLIPAVAYSATVINDIVSMINTFCLNPNTSTFDELRRRRGAFINNDADRGMAAAMSFYRALQELHVGLVGRLISVR